MAAGDTSLKSDIFGAVNSSPTRREEDSSCCREVWTPSRGGFRPANGYRHKNIGALRRPIHSLKQGCFRFHPGGKSHDRIPKKISQEGNPLPFQDGESSSSPGEESSSIPPIAGGAMEIRFGDSCRSHGRHQIRKPKKQC